MIGAWAIAFAITLCVELMVAGWLLRADDTLLRRFGAIGLANVASHPLAFFVISQALGAAVASFILAEVWAVLSEVAVYVLVLRGVGAGRALAVSLLANGASLGVGVVLQAAGWL